MKNLTTKLLIAFTLICLNLFQLQAQVPGEFRSASSGAWSSVLTWQTYNGSIWIPATGAPSFAGPKITVRSPHIVTVTSNLTIDETTVEPGGELAVDFGDTLTILDGPGDDLILMSGNYGIAGSLEVLSGARIAGGASLNYSAPSLINNGTIDLSFLSYAGSVDNQTIFGNGTISQLITFNSAFGIYLGGNLTISNTLNFNYGNCDQKYLNNNISINLY